MIPYATGDFHSGTGTYEGEKKVYHIGYKNYSAYIEQIKHYIGEPDTLLVTGFSAGGFATSLLADDVIDRFPSVKNVTVCVDSSLLLYDGWHETAVEGYYFFLRILSEKLLQYGFILFSYCCTISTNSGSNSSSIHLVPQFHITSKFIILFINKPTVSHQHYVQQVLKY